MEGIRRQILPKIVMLLFAGMMLSIPAMAATPVVSHTMVTDVTTVSFSVIWASDIAATADIAVFEADGVTPPAGYAVEAHPVEPGNTSIQEAAEDNGVMKVRVTGLSADTTYYFQTITTDKYSTDSTVFPETAPLMSVTTAVNTIRSKIEGSDEVPFSNDVIIEECYLEDGTTPAEGTLLLATMEGAEYPLTAFVGDGVESPYALIDLNNAFSRDTRENLDLEQGKNLTLLNFRGMLGNSIVTHNVPEDNSLCEVKPGEFALNPGWNMVSFFLEPESPSVEDVLSPIWLHFNSLWTFNDSGEWISYTKNLPPFMNDLSEIESHKGYWLLMDADYEYDNALHVHGNFDYSLNTLHSGWNMIGSKTIATEAITSIIGQFDNKLQVAWTYEDGGWKSYTPSLPPFMNDIDFAKPGQGYMIYLDESHEW